MPYTVYSQPSARNLNDLWNGIISERGSTLPTRLYHSPQEMPPGALRPLPPAPHPIRADYWLNAEHYGNPEAASISRRFIPSIIEAAHLSPQQFLAALRDSRAMQAHIIPHHGAPDDSPAAEYMRRQQEQRQHRQGIPVLSEPPLPSPICYKKSYRLGSDDKRISPKGYPLLNRK